MRAPLWATLLLPSLALADEERDYFEHTDPQPQPAGVAKPHDSFPQYDDNCPSAWLDLQIAIRAGVDGCLPYGFVDLKGDYSAGLKPTGYEAMDDCNDNTRIQVYARNFTLEAYDLWGREETSELLMFMYYFPKEQLNDPKLSHRHGFQTAVVWTKQNSKGETVVRSICLSDPQPDMWQKYQCFDGDEADFMDVTWASAPFRSKLWFYMMYYHRRDRDRMTGLHLSPVGPGPKSVQFKKSEMNLVNWGDMPPCLSWNTMSDKMRQTMNSDPYKSDVGIVIPMNDWNFDMFISEAIAETMRTKTRD